VLAAPRRNLALMPLVWAAAWFIIDASGYWLDATSAFVVVAFAAALFGIGELGQGLGNMVADVTLNLPNSRLHETEADRIGVELAARAGYDPKAAIRLWEKMAKGSKGGQPPKWLSTHPSHEDRLKDLQVYAEKVMPLYAAAKAGPSAGK
jgi:predicted Zn-dependent protease